MLDFNHGADNISNQLNKLIDTALTTECKKQEVRSYLGASRLGISCSRLLQYEYQNLAKDDGRDFNGQTLRIFEAGNAFEDMATRWLHSTGFTLLTHNSEGKQFGFSAAEGKVRGHVDGVITSVPDGLDIQAPALWEMKSMNHRSWQDTAKNGLILSKPVYASQIALYQAYMEEQFPGISKHPALFTAINKDTSELYHEMIPFDAELAQRMSDKAVNILKACDVDELLPRVASDRNFFECKYCAYQDRCWKEDTQTAEMEVSHD